MASQGPLSPATGTSEARTGGDAHWTNPGDITADDASFATVSLLATNDTSHWLVATNFGFAIPSGATIDGIVAEFLLRETGSGILQAATLWLGGSATGTEKNNIALLSGTFTYESAGGSTDTWDAGLTDTDVNSAGFGVACSVSSANADPTIDCDHVRVTVHYTETGIALSGTASATSTATGNLTLTHNLSGTSAATAAASGNLSVGTLLSGTVSAQSSVTGNLSLAHHLSGTVAAQSTLSGNLLAANIAQSVPILAIRATNERYTLRGTQPRYQIAWTGERYKLVSTEESYRLRATNERYRIRRT